jgi:hypothetical protein
MAATVKIGQREAQEGTKASEPRAYFGARLEKKIDALETTRR